MVWRVLGTGSAVLAGVVANKLVTTVWKKAGRDNVVDPRDPRTPWRTPSPSPPSRGSPSARPR